MYFVFYAKSYIGIFRLGTPDFDIIWIVFRVDIIPIENVFLHSFVCNSYYAWYENTVCHEMFALNDIR